MKKILTKLRSSAGESIAETLIALLISALAMMLLAGMISSTNNLVRTSETKMNNYYDDTQKTTGTADISIQIVETNDSGEEVTGTGSTVEKIAIEYRETTAFGVIDYRYNKSA